MDKKLESRIAKLERIMRRKYTKNESLDFDYDVALSQLNNLMQNINQFEDTVTYCDDSALQNGIYAVKDEIKNLHFVLTRLRTEYRDNIN